MKRFKKLTAFALALVMFLPVLLTACTGADPGGGGGGTGDGGGGGASESPAVVCIDIVSPPDKRLYYRGDAFSAQGLKVSARYSDGTDALLAETDYTVSAPDMLTAGTKNVTVTYKNVSEKFTIAVLSKPAKSISITELPDTLVYERGEALDLTGMVVEAVFEDDTDGVITDYAVSPVNMNRAGVKTVTVYYGGLSDSFEITVNQSQGVHSVAFAPFTMDERDFLYKEHMTGANGEGSGRHRYADGNMADDEQGIGAYWIYCVNAGSALKEAELLVVLGGDYILEISLDCVIWDELKRATGNVAETDIYFALHEYWGDFDKNIGTVFVRFRGRPGVGFGARMYSFTYEYMLVDDGLYTIPVGYPPAEAPYDFPASVDFAAGSADDLKFLYENTGSGIYVQPSEDMSVEAGVTARKGDDASYFTYAIDAGGKMEKAELVLDVAAFYKIWVSLDGINWALLRESGTPAFSWPGSHREVFRFRLDKILDGAGGKPDFTANTGKVFVRFNGLAIGEFTGTWLINFTFNYELSGVAVGGYPQPDTVDYVEPPVNPSLKTLTINLSQEPIARKEGGTGTDANGFYRWADGRGTGNPEDYFVYLVDLSAEGTLVSAEAVLRMKNNSFVQVSVDNVNWQTVFGPAYRGLNNYPLDITQRLNENGGKLYFRFAGDPNTNGFGIFLYNFTINYKIA